MSIALSLFMPSIPRYAIIDNQSLFHVTWQCHNKDWLLKTNWAKQLYYNLLLKYKNSYKIQILAYCFMSNHPHILGYCENKHLFSDFFRIVNSQFAKQFNKQMSRRGQVVMDRFKSPRIDSYDYLLDVMKYIDLNPYRAKMVSHPKEYKWSSFHYYAFGKPDPLITPAPCYLFLGENPLERQKHYRQLIAQIVNIEGFTKKNYSIVYFIGNPFWVIEKTAQLKKQIQNSRTGLNKHRDYPP